MLYLLYMGFWQNVEIEREYQDITRKELAFRAGITYASIGIGLERGSIPAADTALRIAKALNISLEYLLTGDEAKKEETEKAPDGHIHIIAEKIARYSKTIQHMEELPPATRESIISMIDTIAKDLPGRESSK